MAKQVKSISLSMDEKEGTFSSILHKIKSKKKESDLSNLRQLLTGEKARLLYTVKAKQPESIYKLARLLGRDFKAVRHDIRLLEQFGIIELISSYKQGRERLKPVVDADQLVITLNL